MRERRGRWGVAVAINHPFTGFLPDIYGCVRVSTSQEGKTRCPPLSSDPLQLIQEDPRPEKIIPLNPWSSQESHLSGTSTERHPRGILIWCLNHLRWLLFLWRNSGSTPSFPLMMELLALSLRLTWPLHRRRRCLPLVSWILFFQSWSVPHEWRRGLEWKWTSESEALLFSSAPSLQQSRDLEELLLIPATSHSAENHPRTRWSWLNMPTPHHLQIAHPDTLLSTINNYIWILLTVFLNRKYSGRVKIRLLS